MSELSQSTEPIEIFYSYSHADEDLRTELEKHLSILRRQGIIRDWHDHRIGAGQEWKAEIASHLDDADIILLLVSPDFLASDYCWSVEMTQAMERHRAGKAIVIPIILRPAEWESAPFAELQALPRYAKPVTTWPDRDEAFLDIAKGIRKAVNEILEGALTQVDKRAVLEGEQIPKGRIDYHLDYAAALDDILSVFEEFESMQATWLSEFEGLAANLTTGVRSGGRGSAARQRKAVRALGDHVSAFAFKAHEINQKLDRIFANLRVGARKLWEDYRDKNDEKAARKLRDSLEQLTVAPAELDALTQSADELETAAQISRDWHNAARRLGNELRTFVATWEQIGEFAQDLMQEMDPWLAD